eukprot:TRINITY_DN87735_c0_g1_i1.p1 TRINITY_DN87735_c0_g1~~TRINITY_DN87735_c0_g1_i1.p1  ORF type:complete len:547 (+),score=128.65 TRINITY_DN87735_c0_g1_i1:105-1745(+)
MSELALTKDNSATTSASLAESDAKGRGCDDTAWALKRDWTDHAFQDGAESNRLLLQGFENGLVACLQRSWSRASGLNALPEARQFWRDGAESDNVLERAMAPLEVVKMPSTDVRAAVLRDPEVLGSALDMVGAYLKNYAVDKAAAVIETVLPFCLERGCLWKAKALSHLATVRMKQARAGEALETLRQLEALAKELPDVEANDEHWAFWETLYRNLGWAYSALNHDGEAMACIQKAIDVKEKVGKPASWFDLWDLGRMKAAQALKADEADLITSSQAVVTKALWLHRDAEPRDLVMRAKIWHSVGECSFALGFLADGRRRGDSVNSPAVSSKACAHYKKALKCFKESHSLFRKTEGRHNALTGLEAQGVAWTFMKLGQPEESKPYLLDALETLAGQQSGWGDGESEAPALLQAMQIADCILEAHRRTDDRDGLPKYFDAMEKLCANASSRVRVSEEQVAAYEKMVSSCSMVMTASGTDEGTTAGQRLLQRYLRGKAVTGQAKLCNEVMMSLRDGGLGDPAIAREHLSPEMVALTRMLAEAQGIGGR